MKKISMILLALGLVCLPSVAGDDLPSWLKDWKVKGDLRLRFEGKNSDGFSGEKDWLTDRDRMRFRLRIAASKKISDNLDLGIRFASGSGDPTSTNQTFDNSFSGKDWNIDQVQLVYKTGDWKIGGGKVKNPFHTADIIWDSDVNPEGFYQHYSAENGFYATLGEMFVEEISSEENINLGALQLGFKGKNFNVSGSYYSYMDANIVATDSDYTFMDFMAEYSTDLGAVPAKFKVQYVQNTTSGIDDNDTALGVYADFGGSKPGDWKFGLKYAEVEAYSSLTQLSDSDFGQGDKEGFVCHVGYQTTKHVGWLVSAYSVDSIEAQDKGFDMVQVNCVVKF